MDWLKYKKIYFSISGIFIILGIIGLVVWGLPLGIDFKGGTIAEYKISDMPNTEQVITFLNDKNLSISSVQITGDGNYLLKLDSTGDDTKAELLTLLTQMSDKEDASVEELRFEAVGPSIGPDLIKKTFYAIAVASVLILFWIAIQFKSVTYGVAAILAMFHDTFILIGSFSIFGHFWGASADFLFVTAVLTTLSFSVHDTIVVFDRIREIKKKSGEDLRAVSNNAISQTMVRSLNNSFTIIFMLVALVLFGGSTILWFAVALLVGTIAGTYSSPFIAVPLLEVIGNITKKK